MIKMWNNEKIYVNEKCQKYVSDENFALYKRINFIN